MKGERIKPRHVIVFTRYPEPGKTKTRLIPALGPVGAADLHRNLTEHTVDVVKSFAHGHSTGLEICYDGGSRNRFRQWLGHDLSAIPQQKGDLGRRMKTAFQNAFEKGAQQVVLIGTDIPGISEACLENAFLSLSRNDVVLGPSTDGGYFLVGLTRLRDVFSHIEWSTPLVLEQTRNCCRKNNLTCHLLEPLTDVDTAEDLSAWPDDFRPSSIFLSVVIPALNEAGHIAAAVESARNREAEIIVVDGGSTDATVNRVMEAGAMVVSSEKGRALQQNTGARTAKGKMLLFLHADTILPESYMKDVFEILLDRHAILGAFRFATNARSPMMQLFEMGVNLRSTLFQLPYGDQGLFMKKKTFFDLGGFPETSIAEDLILVRRAAKKGVIHISPSAIETSGRRWQKFGMLRTFLINQAVVSGLMMGISPDKLASLYRNGFRKSAFRRERPKTGENHARL